YLSSRLEIHLTTVAASIVAEVAAAIAVREQRERPVSVDEDIAVGDCGDSTAPSSIGPGAHVDPRGDRDVAPGGQFQTVDVVVIAAGQIDRRRDHRILRSVDRDVPASPEMCGR